MFTSQNSHLNMLWTKMQITDCIKEWTRDGWRGKLTGGRCLHCQSGTLQRLRTAIMKVSVKFSPLLTWCISSDISITSFANTATRQSEYQQCLRTRSTSVTFQKSRKEKWIQKRSFVYELNFLGSLFHHVIYFFPLVSDTLTQILRQEIDVWSVF